MRRPGHLLSFGCVLFFAACGGGSASAPGRTVSLGGGVTATLGDDGQLSITRQGRTVLGTRAGTPLFSRALDPSNPLGFHDPKKLGSLDFVRVSGSAIAMDSPAPGVLHLATSDDGMATVLVSLALASDDGFYTGLGERYDHVDPRGQIVGMQLEVDGDYESGTTDRHVPVPWLVSSGGYGVFVKDREAGAWDVGATDPRTIRATFEGRTLDVSIVVDPDPVAVVASLTRLTGLPRKTPAWALSPMMWRHADSQAQVLSDLAQIRSLHIPTSAFWIDDGWQASLDSMDFDTSKFPDPVGFGQSMGALGFELLGWNSPYLQNPASTPGAPPNAAEMLYTQAAASGWFVEEANGMPFSALGPNSRLGLGMIDFTNAAARSFWAGLTGKPIGVGMNGFKLDYGEDMVPDLIGARLDLKLSDGESERTARSYPLGYHGAYRDGLSGTADGGILIVRASTYGGASVADIVWPGDLDNGFQHYGDMASSRLVGGLPSSIVAAQTLSASGFPLYGGDIGGYRGGAPTKEALLRWAEHGALSMVMQLGPGETKYPWSYDAETVSTYASLASLHQKLVTYLASLASRAQTDGTPTLLPVPLAFPTDGDARAFADDEYMVGPSLLVAPITSAGATTRQVHVPPGAWFSWWDGSRVDGPRTLDVPAPLGQPPLYVRGGALLALLPDGIDTLVPASDPSTVSLAAKAGLAEGASWVSGPASASWLDGSAATITDDASGVGVQWTPAGTGSVLTLTLDLQARTGKTAPLAAVTAVSGGALTEQATAAAVRAATTSAYYLAGNQAVLRLVGASSVRIE